MISPDDLAAMRAIASERWRTDGPYVEQHVGDLAWGSNPSLGRELQFAHFAGGGYAFADDDVWHLGGPDDAMPALVELARASNAAAYALEREDAKTQALRNAGYTPAGDWLWHCVHDLADLPPFPNDVGSGADDPDRRVALHRAAWQGSRFTREVYDAVRATPPYRADLDVVVGWNGYALAWLDESSRSGELEPVGTDAAFRRQGWGAKACVAALHRLRDNGATTAVVYAVSDPANQGPRALYESVGFRVLDRHVRYLPPTGQNAAP